MNLLTAEELAYRWRCTPKKLAHDRVKGEGPAFVKLGRARNSPVRYPIDGVEEYEQANLKTSTAR